MESALIGWALNNGVSFLIVFLLFCLWMSWKESFKDVAELAKHKDELLALPNKINGIRESVTYINEYAQKKADCLSAHKEIVSKDDIRNMCYSKEEANGVFATKELNAIIIEELKKTLEYIKQEIHGIREDIRSVKRG